MSADNTLINTLYDYTGTDPNLQDPETAHLAVDQNHILTMNTVPGLNIETEEIEDGIRAHMLVDPGTIVKKPVHLCFGMLPESGVQKILMEVDVKEGAQISLLSHCVFPNAVDVSHIMDANIRIGKNARYTYFEKHVHSPKGGIKVYPSAKVQLDEKAHFKTEFELIKGRVGLIDIDYQCYGAAESVLEMVTRISGLADDLIKIKETGYLQGAHARGALTSKIAVRDRARAEVHNKLVAEAEYARGHVDCKEIIQDEGIAAAIPIVEVKHPKAHITHEAAIGSVDNKQLETLMARGLDEDKAVDLIINGMLS
jgi:hypothetical protein